MKKIIFLCLFLVFLVNARIAVNIELDRERVTPREEFSVKMDVLRGDLEQFNPRELPQIETQDGFTFLSLDSSDTYIRDFFDRYPVRRYVFRLKAPNKTGRLNIGSITWNIQGKSHNVYSAIPVNIEKSLADAAVEVSLIPNKKTIYEGEQIYVTLNILTYPHFAGGLVAENLDLGNDFIAHRADLSELKFKRIPNTFEQQAKAKFAWISPTKSGDLSIPPFSFKYNKQGEPKVVEEKKTVGSMSMSFKSIKQETEEAIAKTNPVKIKVLPLPANKPENFSGMVGDYSFDANVDKSNLKVGDALTLSIKIKGDGKPGTITDPLLPDFSDFRAVPPENSIDKKIIRGKVITTKNIRIFLYPKRKGSFEIPTITYSWFNPVKKVYETTSAGPFKIEVEKGDSQNNNEMVSYQNQAETPKQEIETLASDIRYVKRVPENSTGKPLYLSISYLILLTFPIPLYFVLILLWKRHRKNANNSTLVRKSKAGKNLKHALSEAEIYLKENNTKDFYSALENALIGFLSDKTNLEFRGMLKQTRMDVLKEHKLSDTQIDEIESWIEKCSFARFAPKSGAEENLQVLTQFKKFVSGLENLK